MNPAFPVINDGMMVNVGLTKREYVASQIMAGMVREVMELQGEPKQLPVFLKNAARISVSAADLLMEELNG